MSESMNEIWKVPAGGEGRGTAASGSLTNVPVPGKVAVGGFCSDCAARASSGIESVSAGTRAGSDGEGGD